MPDTAGMSDSDHQRKPRASLSTWLWLGAIVLVVAVAAWWALRPAAEPAAHAETAQFLAVDPAPVILAERFRSYASESTVAAALEADGLTLQRAVIERPPSPRYPPRRQTQFTVRGYEHLNSTGTLVLEFFNDRLMEVDFRPEEAAPYALRLHRQYPALKRDRNGYSEWIEGPARLWASVDLARSKVGRSLGTEGVVLWQDLRLTAQRDDWDARFGHIPPPAPK